MFKLAALSLLCTDFGLCNCFEVCPVGHFLTSCRLRMGASFVLAVSFVQTVSYIPAPSFDRTMNCVQYLPGCVHHVRPQLFFHISHLHPPRQAALFFPVEVVGNTDSHQIGRTGLNHNLPAGAAALLFSSTGPSSRSRAPGASPQIQSPQSQLLDRGWLA